MGENLPRSTEIGTTQKSQDFKGQHLVEFQGRGLCVHVQTFCSLKWTATPLWSKQNIEENSGPAFYVLFAAGLPPVRTSKSSKNMKIDHCLVTTEEWSMKNDVKEFPTNAFGHIKFENVYNSTLKPAKVCNWIKILIMLTTRQQSQGFQ